MGRHPRPVVIETCEVEPRPDTRSAVKTCAGEDEVDAGQELGPVIVLVESRGKTAHEWEAAGIELLPLLGNVTEER